ncbi:hypothetical protein M514_03202, partial [Trichuris suis]
LQCLFNNTKRSFSAVQWHLGQNIGFPGIQNARNVVKIMAVRTRIILIIRAWHFAHQLQLITASMIINAMTNTCDKYGDKFNVAEQLTKLRNLFYKYEAKMSRNKSMVPIMGRYKACVCKNDQTGFQYFVSGKILSCILYHSEIRAEGFSYSQTRN